MTGNIVQNGMSIALGAVLEKNGVNFAIYSKDATSVKLCLFNSDKASEPSQIIELDSTKNKTGDIWHVFVEGLSEGALYLYLIDGPYDPTKGKRFN
ncbi:MAG: glycogen debranching enzyme, partial [Treponema bryantii]|nr:glycogen debranching enzyme [Treponema bryantii]